MIILSIIIAIAFFIHLSVSLMAKRIQQTPEPYGYETFSQEPQGESVFIKREDGTQIYAKVAGSGSKTAVLAHGYGVSVVLWNTLSDMLLEEGYRVIAFNLRGHSQSTIGKDGIGSRQMAEDYKAVLDYFDVKNGVLVGHSTGGFLSGVFALNHPETANARLSGIVFAGATMGNILEGSLQNRLQIPMIRSGFGAWVSRTAPYSWLFGASLFGDVAYPSAVRVFNEIFATQPHKKLAPIMRALAEEDYYPRLHEIQIPSVVVCGRKDRSTPPWHSVEIGKRIPNARNVWLDGIGHAVNWEAPQVILESIESLITEDEKIAAFA